ncbi:SH3 domain-containing protein [Antarcticimicrobium sediminis]|uniref:SH3 domain-containing protein n=1 Tax=Antarcticimicrobium sediminis TaxID=2546227 RepID=UPI001404390A|nr:SH3 domain-containing protein [Antarcticimicrobium sediminis]
MALGTGAASADSFRYVQQGVNLNARSGPGSHYAAKRVLAPGTRLSVIQQRGDWAQVQTTEGLLLWVFGSYLRDQAPQTAAPRQPAQPQRKPVQQQVHRKPVQQHQQQPAQQQTPQRVRPQTQQQTQQQPQRQTQQQQTQRPQQQQQQQQKQQPQQRGNTDNNEIRMIKPNGTIIYKGR